MTNEPSSEAHSDKVWIIDAICFNCNKRFTCPICFEEEQFFLAEKGDSRAQQWVNWRLRGSERS